MNGRRQLAKTGRGDVVDIGEAGVVEFRTKHLAKAQDAPFSAAVRVSSIASANRSY